MKKFLHIFVLFLLVALCLVIVPQSSVAAEKEFKVGCVLALTGPLAPVGIPFRNGVQLAADVFNAKGGLSVGGEKYMIKLIDADSKFTPEGATTGARRLVDAEKANMIVGEINSPQTLGVLSVTEPAKIITLHTAAANETLKDRPYAFRSYISYYEMYPGIFKWLAKNRPKAKKVALLDMDDESARYGHQLVTKASKMVGMEVVYDEYFDPTAKDFNPFLLKALSKNPDIIYNCASAGTSWGLIMKQARDLGYKGLFVENHPPAVGEQVQIAGKEAIQGLIGFGYTTEGDLAPAGLKKFKADYEKKWGTWASHAMVPGIPAAAIFMAVEQSGSLDTGKIISVLESGKKWDTPFGVTGSFAGAETYGRPHQWFAPQFALEVKGEDTVTVGVIPLEDMIDGWK